MNRTSAIFNVIFFQNKLLVHLICYFFDSNPIWIGHLVLEIWTILWISICLWILKLGLLFLLYEIKRQTLITCYLNTFNWNLIGISIWFWRICVVVYIKSKYAKPYADIMYIRTTACRNGNIMLPICQNSWAYTSSIFKKVSHWNRIKGIKKYINAQ